LGRSFRRFNQRSPLHLNPSLWEACVLLEPEWLPCQSSATGAHWGRCRTCSPTWRLNTVCQEGQLPEHR